MDQLPLDIIYIIERRMLDLNDLNTFCKLSTKYRNYCISNADKIAKYYIKKYQIDYTDPNNFIYEMNSTPIERCKYDNGEYNYKKIISLYLPYYNQREIICSGRNISSIPIYPKLEILDCGFNNLETLPEYPNLVILDCSFNYDIQTLPEYPNLERLYCNSSGISKLPDYPKLEVLDCSLTEIKKLSNHYPKLQQLIYSETLQIDRSEYPNTSFTVYSFTVYDE